MAVRPNLVDYETTCASFSWSDGRRLLDGLPGGRGLNIAHEAVDRHLQGPAADRVALLFVGRSGGTRSLSYRDLSALTSQFANVLDDLGVQRGQTVFTLTGPMPELYVTALGSLKHGNVFCPLFTGFGPEPIRQRLARGDGRVLVTTSSRYRRHVAGIRALLPDLQHVLIVDDDSTTTKAPAGTIRFATAMAGASDQYQIPPTDPEDPAMLHFTSGTTGMPKGAVHVHDAVVAHHVTGGFALDLHPEDVFWCTADPGWVTGTSYGMISPLTHGVTSIVDEVGFNAERWLQILEQYQVSVWYTSPTAVRMLMRLGPAPAAGRDLERLRFIASVGEPLNPEAVVWGQHALGVPIHDNWWQTETGGIMIANCAATTIKPGSMGRPLPGVEATVLRRRPDEHVVSGLGGSEVVDEPGVEGELALRPGWPSMFRGYLAEEERYRRCFVGGWYLTGDLVRRDADGYFWFVSRVDDLIKSSGHLIGPFEVERALMEHPAVVEAGVIGTPDPVAGELVKALVVLRPGFEPTEELRLELIGFGRTRLGAAVAPKELRFIGDLPHTKSGKIMRRLLKARELGFPEGDLSTLQKPEEP